MTGFDWTLIALFYAGIGNARTCRMIARDPEDFAMTCYALRFSRATVMLVETLGWPLSMVLK
jgi:hypothetical protein